MNINTLSTAWVAHGRRQDILECVDNDVALAKSTARWEDVDSANAHVGDVQRIVRECEVAVNDYRHGIAPRAFIEQLEFAREVRSDLNNLEDSVGYAMDLGDHQCHEAREGY